MQANHLLAALQTMSETAGPIVVASAMANLKAMSAATLQNAVRIELLGYYAVNDGGGGEFIWNGLDARPDDGGVIIRPTAVAGNGRLNRIVGGLSDPYLHSGWYGVRADNATDNSARLQALLDAAMALSIWNVYIDPCPNSSINFATPLMLHPGLVIRGAGMNVSNLKCTNATDTTFAFKIWTPIAANAGRKAPKFCDLSLTCRSGIQINNPAGGFTDDRSSQEPLQGCFIERCGIYCSHNNVSGTTGIQLSKVSEGVIQKCNITGFGIHIDLQGSENCRIRDKRLVGATLEFINAQGHGTFGNGLVIDSNFMAEMVTGGNAYVVSSFKSVTVTNNWLEGAGNYTACFWLQSATSAVAVIQNNVISMQPTQVTNSLKVDDPQDGTTSEGYLLIDYRNNQGAEFSGGHATATFNGGRGAAYFVGSGGFRRKIFHQGNLASAGDIGFPFNTRGSSLDAQNPTTNVVAYYSPNDDGLKFACLGKTVKCLNGAFQITATGSTNYLDFGNTDKPAPTGSSLKLYVLASSASGGSINAAITDGGAVVGSFVTKALTTKPAWYQMNPGATVNTSGGARVYASTNDVKLYAVVLSQ
jgi:hypothetical protein